MRSIVFALVLAVAACDNAPSILPPASSANAQVCVHEPVNVRIDHNQIFWNSDLVDEAELARRSASHWCGERPYAIMTEQALPDPGDKAALALSMRVGKLIGTKQATLADTLKQLADGTY